MTDHRSDGQLAAAISNSGVRALARTTGRGPTMARTTLGDDERVAEAAAARRQTDTEDRTQFVHERREQHA
jgi:hypothetical protein